MEIETLGDENAEEWDRFVISNPEGRFSQLSGYKRVVEKTYGYKPYYLIFRDDRERIIGVFPSFIKKTFTWTKLISQPFSEYGGPLFTQLSDHEKEKIKDFFRKLEYNLIEIHAGTGLGDMEGIFVKKRLYQYAILRLREVDKIWAGIDRGAKKALRKAERAGLVCYDETSDDAIKKRFYPLYLKSMKRLGTPPHSINFYLNASKYLRNNMKIFFVDHRKRSIASLLGFTTGRRIHIITSASEKGYWDLRPNDLVHWEFIRWGCENGYKNFDFGPVRYEGQERFKKKWGCELYDYSYYYLNTVKMGQIESDFLSSIWKRTIPLKLTQKVGPLVRKSLGR